MADEELERLNSFRSFIRAAEQGAAIPAVSEYDLKSLHDLCVDMTKHYAGKDGVVSLDLMSRACTPGANLPAVWLRHTQLRRLVRQGILAQWQHGTALEGVVYRVAATIPLNDLHLDPEVFLRELRAATANVAV